MTSTVWSAVPPLTRYEYSHAVKIGDDIKISGSVSMGAVVAEDLLVPGPGLESGRG